MPVISTLDAKGLFPENHPLWVWSGLGAACPKVLREVYSRCDAALVIGARLGELDTGNYTAVLPEKCIHVHSDMAVTGANHPCVPITSSVGEFVDALLLLLKKKDSAMVRAQP